MADELGDGVADDVGAGVGDGEGVGDGVGVGDGDGDDVLAVPEGVAVPVGAGSAEGRRWCPDRDRQREGGERHYSPTGTRGATHRSHRRHLPPAKHGPCGNLLDRQRH
jgi:hypothetical protein